MFQGAYTAMITPFKDGAVDYDRLSEHVRFQIDGGIDGLVPCGTTGESPTLSHEEHRKVIEHVVTKAREIADAGGPGGKRVQVIAGTGSNSTDEALELTAHAKKVGADGALMVNPYYNKPTQEGLYRHFMLVAEKVDIPIVLYNIPGRCGVQMNASTVARLNKHPNIVCIKEATGSMDMTSEILSLCDIRILSGDDSLTLPLMAIGGRGVISVLSNLLPREVKNLVEAAHTGKFAVARQLHKDLFNLCKVMFIETNPIPIKTAMMMAGRDTGELRLPMCEMSSENKAVLEKALRGKGLVR
ncbi:MAG: 4-hydroxy-tetrahydrodipicolinate synthase [Phycisphaeraceae bacterium]